MQISTLTEQRLNAVNAICHLASKVFFYYALCNALVFDDASMITKIRVKTQAHTLAFIKVRRILQNLLLVGGRDTCGLAV